MSLAGTGVARRRASCRGPSFASEELDPIVSSETLQTRRIGDELLTLVRRGDQFRIVSLPAAPGARVRSAATASRWSFRSPEVARRAFTFAVAAERFWAARLDGRRVDGLAIAVTAAAVAFRSAALGHDDLPEALVMRAATPRA